VLPESFALVKTETNIGRDAVNDIHLSWDGMSRNHAKIMGSGGDVNLVSGSGSAIPSSFRIVDSGGVNGTYLNSVRVMFF
jgi:pSer/pThr/pTyr-binding forkhead associated (FHA) protein